LDVVDRTHHGCDPEQLPRQKALGVAYFLSKAALGEDIDAYIAHWRDDPMPQPYCRGT
jgi:hypothetical protein